MSSTDNLTLPLFITEKLEIATEDCKALHAVTRQAEQALKAFKAQQNSQSNEKQKEAKNDDGV